MWPIESHKLFSTFSDKNSNSNIIQCPPELLTPSFNISNNTKPLNVDQILSLQINKKCKAYVSHFHYKITFTPKIQFGIIISTIFRILCSSLLPTRNCLIRLKEKGFLTITQCRISPDLAKYWHTPLHTHFCRTVCSDFIEKDTVLLF